MRGQLEGTVALVSGAASGIGAATAQLLVARGARVIVADIDEAGAVSTAKHIGESAEAWRLDVRSSREWDEVVAHCVDSYGSLDLLVNSAACLRDAPLLEVSEAELRNHLDVNLIGCFLGLRAAASAMLRKRHGTIINIASVSGAIAHRNRGAYAISKWAARGLVKTAALEWAEAGIRVCSVLPGAIDTPMARRAREMDPTVSLKDVPFSSAPLGRFGQPEEVAGLIAYLASSEAGYITGAEFVIDGGFLLT